MTPITRQNVLEHVFSNILKATPDPNHHFRAAFAEAGIDSIVDMLSMTKEDWMSIQYQVGEDLHQLRVAHVNTLMSLNQWYIEQGTHDDAVFIGLDAEGLTEFRRHKASQPIVSPAPVPSPAPVHTAALSPADEFKKGIKRDVTAYSVFRERKHWNTWYRDFHATAIAQGLANVLDPSYVPSTPEEQALFDLLQSFLFAVFTKTLCQADTAELVS